MNRRTSVPLVLLTAFIATSFLLVVVFHDTFYGLALQKIAPWKEESFIGRPYSELCEYLSTHNRRLIPQHSDSVLQFRSTGLASNQRLLLFSKGRDYRWFWIGNATNVGYVIVEEAGGEERVIEIIRSQSVDAP